MGCRSAGARTLLAAQGSLWLRGDSALCEQLFLSLQLTGEA